MAGIFAAKFCDPEPLPPPTMAKREAQKAERIFIHKLKIVFKELNETTIWLEVIAESSVLSPENIVAIVAENRELCRIIAASIKTARASIE